MHRFVEFYCEEAGRKVRVPIYISINRDVEELTLEIKIPEQNIKLPEEVTLADVRDKRYL